MVWDAAFERVTVVVNQKFRRARIFCDAAPAHNRHGATNGVRLGVGCHWVDSSAGRRTLHLRQLWTVQSICPVHPGQAKPLGTVGSSQSQRPGVLSSKDLNPGRRGIS